MSRPNEKELAGAAERQEDRLDFDPLSEIDNLGAGGAKFALLESERELLRELVHALRTIRFGSIVLTLHEGQVVEINKSIRIRRGGPNRKV